MLPEGTCIETELNNKPTFPYKVRKVVIGFEAVGTLRFVVFCYVVCFGVVLTQRADYLPI
jgi:hypothetical protein